MLQRKGIATGIYYLAHFNSAIFNMNKQFKKTMLLLSVGVMMLAANVVNAKVYRSFDDITAHYTIKNSFDNQVSTDAGRNLVASLSSTGFNTPSVLNPTRIRSNRNTVESTLSNSRVGLGISEGISNKTYTVSIACGSTMVLRDSVTRSPGTTFQWYSNPSNGYIGSSTSDSLIINPIYNTTYYLISTGLSGSSTIDTFYVTVTGSCGTITNCDALTPCIVPGNVYNNGCCFTGSSNSTIILGCGAAVWDGNNSSNPVVDFLLGGWNINLNPFNTYTFSGSIVRNLAGSTYLWMNGGVIANISTYAPTGNVTQNFSFTVKTALTDTIKTITARADGTLQPAGDSRIDVAVTTPMYVYAGKDTTMPCGVDSIMLNAKVQGGAGNSNSGYTYSWTSIPAGFTASTQSITAYVSSNVKFVVTVSNGSCSLSDTVSVATMSSCPEICNNGIDDDGDGLVDCQDPDCPCSNSCTSGGVFPNFVSANSKQLSVGTSRTALYIPTNAVYAKIISNHTRDNITLAYWEQDRGRDLIYVDFMKNKYSGYFIQFYEWE